MTSAVLPAVQRLEATYRAIAYQRMAGVPLLHPGLVVQGVGFAPEIDHPGLALGVLVTPWFMNLLRLPLQPEAAAALPAPGNAAEVAFGGRRFCFFGHAEAGCGPFAAASLVSPMQSFRDQVAAVATARAVLEQLRPVPPRRSFFFGRSTAASRT